MVLKLKEEYKKFQDLISKLGIEYLVHFTKFQSMTAIVGEGRILPRDQLHNISSEWKELIAPNCVGDKQRRDSPSYLCTSVMHPNIYLLNIFRDSNNWASGSSKFCIVGIEPKYIYARDTEFSISNATYSSSRKFGINGKLETFEKMFDEVIPTQSPGNLTYRKSSIPSFITTNAQAEVRIKCEIPYNDILFIACRNRLEHDLLVSAFSVLGLSTEKLCVRSTLFEYKY